MYVIVPTTIPAIEMDRALRPSAKASFMSPLLAAEDDRAEKNKNIVFKKHWKTLVLLVFLLIILGVFCYVYM